ncbi:MAG: hypothetical protein VX223_12720, partial [Myxococcota bacterium]|nr:hypothetical protein [Myxococcota bacterium]
MKVAQHNLALLRCYSVVILLSLVFVETAIAQTAPSSSTTVKNDTQATTATRPRKPRRPKSYDIKLRELEERAVGLKEKIYETKTRLMLLREQLLGDGVEEARAVIVHHNDMGASFTLERV